MILTFFIALISGIAIGYYICTNNYRQSGLLIIEDSKWTLDLHIPTELVCDSNFIVLKVIHEPNMA